MKKYRLLSLTTAGMALSLFSFALHAEGDIFIKTSDAPRTSKTPRGITLKSAPGSEEAFTVRAALAEIRLDNSSSRGSAGMTGRLNTFRKFVRLDFRGVSRLSSPKSVTVKYAIEEGDRIRNEEDTIQLSGVSAPNFIVDTKGFQDVTGTEVKSTSSVTTITSTKYKHYKAEIVGVDVTVNGSTGKTLYAGSWPEPSTVAVELPPRLRPRTFTASDGRKVTAKIADLGQDKVTLDINGKPFLVNFSSLSEEDQKYLRGLQQTLGDSE